MQIEALTLREIFSEREKNKKKKKTKRYKQWAKIDFLNNQKVKMVYAWIYI